jgi:hypothetical protein
VIADMALVHRSNNESGAPAWLWCLGALASLELEHPNADGFNAQLVLRTGLDLSGNRATVDIRYVRKLLDELADELCVECQRDGEVVLWSLTDGGRERLAVFVQALDRLRELVIIGRPK